MAVFVSNANFTVFFINTMDYVMQGLYDYGNILIYLLLGFSFLFNILSLRKIRFLRTNIEQLVERIKIIENQGFS